MRDTLTLTVVNGNLQQVVVLLGNSPGEAFWEKEKKGCFYDIFPVTENFEVFQETWLIN